MHWRAVSMTVGAAAIGGFVGYLSAPQAAALTKNILDQAGAAYPTIKADSRGPIQAEGASIRSSEHHLEHQPVKTVKARSGLLAMDVPTTGWAEAADTTTIAALEAGPVTEVKAADGQAIHAGTPIVQQDDREAKALVAKDKANLASDQASLAETEAALARARTLLNENIQSKQAVEQAQENRDEAAAKVDADQAILAADLVALENLSIRAPYDGRLGSILVSQGSYLGVGSSVVSITQSDPIYVSFRLPQRYLPLLQQGIVTTAVEVEAARDSGSGMKGQLTFFDNNVDQASGTVLAKARFTNNNAQLWPGQSVSLVVHFRPDEIGIIVPTVAVRAGADGPFVYTVDDQQKVHATPVQVVRANGDLTLIAHGLSQGRHVVVEGQGQLFDAQSVEETLLPDEPSAGAMQRGPAPAKEHML